MPSSFKEPVFDGKSLDQWLNGVPFDASIKAVELATVVIVRLCNQNEEFQARTREFLMKRFLAGKIQKSDFLPARYRSPGLTKIISAGYFG